jgi:hypothetical protein
MAGQFEVTYSAGGSLDKVKEITNIVGGIINEIQTVDNIPQLDTLLEMYSELQTIDSDLNTMGTTVTDILGNLSNTASAINELDADLIGPIKTDLDNLLVKLDHVNVDTVDTVNTVNMVTQVGKVSNFPTLTQPFNEMVTLSMPAIGGEYVVSYTTPAIPTEIMCLTVTCSGYGEADFYNIFCNGNQWFKNWSLSEVKEGLYLGSSTYVYEAPPSSFIELDFNNVSCTAKTLWFGIRMLT